MCTFNDDIQSTAAAVIGAVYGALRLRGVPPLREQVFLFFGAGQANIGTARLLVAALADEGLSEAQAKKNIWLYDSKASTQCSDVTFWLLVHPIDQMKLSLCQEVTPAKQLFWTL